MPVLQPGAAIAAALFALAALAGCSSESPPPAEKGPTPIAAYGSPALSRIAFCDLVPDEAVTTALGGPSEESRSWDNGDKARVAAGTGPGGDIVHEQGCEWTRGSGPAATVARAWVFARPVAAAFAAEMIAEAGTRKGCAAGTPPAFGSPSLLQTCPVGRQRERVRHAGLFGDTWLACEVAGARTDGVPERAGAWCVSVAESLEAR